jgi:hypothetical protein
MTDKQFWRSTPVKLNVLSAAHADANNPHKVRKANTVEEVGFEI